MKSEKNILIQTYHEDGINAFDFTGLGRQRLVAHVPHQAQEALDGQDTQVRLQPKQALFDGHGGILDEIHLFLPGPLGTIRLAFTLLALLLALQ